MTKSFAFFIFCWGDTPSIFILFQNLCDHFDCGLERCVLQISNITSQTNRNSHTYQEVLSEWSSDYSEHARSQHCDVSYYVQRLWKESKQTNKQQTPPPPAVCQAVEKFPAVSSTEWWPSCESACQRMLELQLRVLLVRCRRRRGAADADVHFNASVLRGCVAAARAHTARVAPPCRFFSSRV